mmetsp:Transcript_80495/g.163053  ORF Transcript_80495/g.163053 Transcript_80495/m.163053 type:complete len:174 (-) Transcript_80495:86-607(-)
MKQYCIVMYGFMCVIEGVFEIISLIMMAKGRTESATQKSVVDLGGSAKQVTYTTTSETHPMFDASQGAIYNIQSATTIISPVVMIVGAVLSYYTYKAFSAALAEMDEEEQQPLYGSGRSGLAYGGGSANSSMGSPGSQIGGRRVQQQQQGGRQAQAAPAGPRLFEGAGHRLGD